MSSTTPSTTDVLNPATEEVITTLDLADEAETDRAIEAAHRAFESWREVSPADRARLLRRFAAVVDNHVEELAQLEVRNAGHTIGNARWEAGNVRDVLAYYAGAPERPGGGRRGPTRRSARARSRRGRRRRPPAGSPAPRRPSAR